MILNPSFLLHILLLDCFDFSAFIMLFIDKNRIKVIVTLGSRDTTKFHKKFITIFLN